MRTKNRSRRPFRLGAVEIAASGRYRRRRLSDIVHAIAERRAAVVLRE